MRLYQIAIEGEEGYNPTLTREWMRGSHSLITYGIYESGASWEGTGKGWKMITTLLAAAKRGYSLLGHPHLKAFGNNFLPAIIQPFGHGFTRYGNLGGSGSDDEKGRMKITSLDAIGLKYAYPDDPAVDFVWKNYIQNSDIYKDVYGYQYQMIRTSNAYLNSIIPAAVYALDYDDVDFDTRAAEVIPKNFFGPERGIAIMRSGTDSLALSSNFHCRQNLGGHNYADRNDFTLSGLGRIWVRKSTLGSSGHDSYFNSCILINDFGIKRNIVAWQPGKILDYATNDDIATVTGDATYAHTWEYHWEGNPNATDHPWLGTNGWEKVMETFNDFQYEPIPHYYMDIPMYDYAHWWHGQRSTQIVKRIYRPMERVIRSSAMIDGEHPFLFIVDDVQMNANVNNYKWVAQIANDLTIESTAVNLVNWNFQNDIILKEPDETGNRRLLVRILHNEDYDGSSTNGYVEELEYENYMSNPSQLAGAQLRYRQRLVVESNSVAPDFRVMMYPHNAGDPLPTTQWNSTKDSLRVIFSNEQHFIALNPQDGGKWNKIERIDESVLVSTCDDGDDCTLDDNYFSNCDCIGVLQDDDNDLICNDIDVCPNFNDSLIDTACDDGDPFTALSFYDSNCNCSPSYNKALTGTASMSSGEAFRGDYLNDGIVDDNNLLAYTGSGSLHEWMQIDLAENNQISEVIIWNRTNCCSNRLNNAYVLVSDTPFPNDTDLTTALANATFTYQIGDVSQEAIVSINVAQTGRYVRLQKSGNNEGNDNNGANSLNILEFQVIGNTLKVDLGGDGVCGDVDVCPDFDDNLIGTVCDDGDPCTELSIYKSDCNCVPEFNFASVGTPSLSTGSPTQASYLTDGIISNSFLSHTSNNSPHEWMEIDLGEVRNIKDVVIYNRTNCCKERLDNVYMLISDMPFSSNYNLNAALSIADFTYQIGDASQKDTLMIDVQQFGRYVRLQKSGNNNGGNYLNILELKINGALLDSDGDGVCDAEDICSEGEDNIDQNNDGFPDACQKDCINSITIYQNTQIVNDAEAYITISTSGTVPNGANIKHNAGGCIELLSEFEVEPGAEYHAFIAPCGSVQD